MPKTVECVMIAYGPVGGYKCKACTCAELSACPAAREAMRLLWDVRYVGDARIEITDRFGSLGPKTTAGMLCKLKRIAKDCKYNTGR